MKTVIEARLDALQACIVALAATISPDGAPLARRLMAAAAADQEDPQRTDEADAAMAAVFAEVLQALTAVR